MSIPSLNSNSISLPSSPSDQSDGLSSLSGKSLKAAIILDPKLLDNATSAGIISNSSEKSKKCRKYQKLTINLAQAHLFANALRTDKAIKNNYFDWQYLANSINVEDAQKLRKYSYLLDKRKGVKKLPKPDQIIAKAYSTAAAKLRENRINYQRPFKPTQEHVAFLFTQLKPEEYLLRLSDDKALKWEEIVNKFNTKFKQNVLISQMKAFYRRRTYDHLDLPKKITPVIESTRGSDVDCLSSSSSSSSSLSCSSSFSSSSKSNLASASSNSSKLSRRILGSYSSDEDPFASLNLLANLATQSLTPKSGHLTESDVAKRKRKTANEEAKKLVQTGFSAKKVKK